MYNRCCESIFISLTKIGLVAMRKALDAREDKAVSTDSLIKLPECVLKNNVFELNTSFYKQLRGLPLELKWLHLMQ